MYYFIKRVFTKTMQRRIKICLLLAAILLPATSFAQLSSNPDKFLGNITTGNSNMDFNGFKFSDYWNQVTPENATKWESVEGTRGQYNWGGADNAYTYAKSHNFPFKFHCFVWGSQFPKWIKDLSPSERYKAIGEWMDAAKNHYPDLQLIDVVNEAMNGHQGDTYLMQEALGGNGKTGYDWLIKAFEMAHERWPDAILIYNDYNVLQWGVNEFIGLVGTLRDAGAPIDAYGCQAHHFTLNNCSQSTLKNNLSTIQNGLKMPMYITEYDISFANDADQEKRYKEQIPLFWEADYCAGITLWGWFVGNTWADNTGLIKNGQERSALKWLREYMATDAAKNAKSPYPGMKKEASIFIRPTALKVAKGDVLPIYVRASMATKTIEKVDLFVGSELIATMTEAPYLAEYTATTSGYKDLKAVVTTTDGSTYERYGRFQVLSSTTKREPYNDIVPQLPGTINAGEFDNGASSVSYSGVSTTVYKSRDKFSTTATQTGAWMEYTVDVTEDGLYTLEAEVASTKEDGSFHLAEYTFDNLKFLTEFTTVPKTGSANEFQILRCPVTEYLTAGRHVLTLLVDNGGFYIKNLKFNLLPTFNLPGTVEAEDMVKSEGGNIISIPNGFALGNLTTNNWAEYSVNVTQAGKYSYEATVSSDVAGTKFNMYLIDAKGDSKSLGMVKVPNTSSKDVYQAKAGNIRENFSEGLLTLRIVATGGNCNIDNIKFTCTEPAGISDVMNDNTSDAPAYNLMGVPVNANYRGIVIKNGRKVVVK